MNYPDEREHQSFDWNKDAYVLQIRDAAIASLIFLFIEAFP